MSDDIDDDDRPSGHEDLKALAERLGRPLYTLRAQDAKTDPFLAGMPARRRDAEWFAEVWNRVGGKRGFHLRRLHYRVLSQDPPILMPDGTPYINTVRCVATLYNGGRDARHLGLIDSDDLVDRKNPPPTIFMREGESGEIQCHGGLGELAEPKLEIPRLVLAPPITAQAYQVEIWCEKSTMNDVLMPLGERYGVNVVTGTGEISETRCNELVQRAEESDRPVRILYASDFDPAGDSMPVAAARKIEYALYRLQRYDLDIQVRPVVLTHDQCVEYRLPRIPIKDEARAQRFEERFGEGATELDALEALHPGELERILVREIERYHDTTLDERVDEVADAVDEDLAEVNEHVRETHAEEIAELEREREAVVAAIEAFKRKAEPILRAIEQDLEDGAPDVDLDYDWPEPDEGDEDDDPLFDSTRTYLEQIDRYKDHQDKPTRAPPRKELDQYTYTCQVCGKSFLSARPAARCCSAVCRTALYKKKIAEGHEPKKQERERKQFEATCVRCGKTFMALRRDTQYCSGACNTAAFKQRRKEAAEK
jgi:hypothetical protein